jgi:hypothetical protein
MTDSHDFRALTQELNTLLVHLVSTHPDLHETVIRAYLYCSDRATAALATPEPEPPTDEERLADFAQWLAREMPPNTIIGDPLWWAPRIWRAALER